MARTKRRKVDSAERRKTDTDDKVMVVVRLINGTLAATIPGKTSTSIAALKDMIHDSEGTPAKLQKLLLASGQPCRNATALGSYTSGACYQEERRMLDGYGSVTFSEMCSKLNFGVEQKDGAELLWKFLENTSHINMIELTLVRLGNFIAASEFGGAREGYAFKHGEHGLGYYVDEVGHFGKLIKEDPVNLLKAADSLMKADYGSAVPNSIAIPLRLFTRRKEVAWTWFGTVRDLIGGGLNEEDDSWDD